MKRFFSIILLIIVLGSTVLADVQPGYVRTIKRPGKNVEYLDNVQISVKGISGSFKSKKKGKFELELQPLNLKVGNSFNLNSVFKSGYELYDNNLERVYSPGVPVEIVLRNISQEAADQQKFADNMYKGSLANRDKKIRELDKQVKEGKITQEKYHLELQRFNDVFDKYQADINTIAKRYAGLDYQNIDPVTEAINVAFSNGDFVLADSLLNTLGSIDAEIDANISARADINAKENFGKAIVEEANTERKQNLKDAERLAELAYAKHLSFLNNFQNDSAAYYLEKRAGLLPENVRYQLEAANFLQEYLANYPLALDYSTKALELAQKQYGENHQDVASCYNHIGTIYCKQGEYVKALENLKNALQIRLDILGENHPNVATSYSNLGSVYKDKGEFVKALENFNKALCIDLYFFGETHSNVATDYGNIGSIYDNQGEYVKALENHGKAMKIRLEIFGENHPDVAGGFNNIGSVYGNQGEDAKALENFNNALKIFLIIYGENHPDVAVSYNNIGYIYANQGEYCKARENYEKALNTQLDIFGEKHPYVALGYNNIGTVYAFQGDLDKALDYFEKALRIRLEIFGENNPYIASSYNNIGTIYANQGDYTKALENYQKVLKIQLEKFGEKHPNLALCYKNIGTAYFNQGEYAKALENYEKALKIRLEIFGEDHQSVTKLREEIANTHRKMEEQDKQG